jgi:hypothetical protein
MSKFLDYETPKPFKRRQIGCLPVFLVAAIALAVFFAWDIWYRREYHRQVRQQVCINATATVVIASAILFVIWWRRKRT